MTDRPLSEHTDPAAPLDLSAYRATGGYRGLEKALSMGPEKVQDLVEAANLRGRGGAGFPAGTKWGFVPMGEDAPHPKYFVVNADEMEPGTFKDRYLLEGNPHLVLEGALIGARAVEADVIYLFLRWAYRRAARRLEQAIAELKDAGLLERPFGSSSSFEIHVHVSAGRYIAGEETGLLEALEGRRAIPRDKPPFPQASGLWGKPTIVNNVETVACVPGILRHGAEWFRELGRGDDAGTKLYGASGPVNEPGLWELPIGTPLGEVLEEHAGGMKDGHALRGVLPGGASTAFLTEDHLDVPLDFAGCSEAGSRLGTGCLVVLDDQTCPVGMIHNLEVFFAHESCGWCTPCREGLPWTAQLLQALERGEGEPGDLDMLEHHCTALGMGRTFCPLAPGAVMPLSSGLKYFRDDFERHLRAGCPYGGA